MSNPAAASDTSSVVKELHEESTSELGIFLDIHADSMPDDERDALLKRWRTETAEAMRQAVERFRSEPPADYEGAVPAEEREPCIALDELAERIDRMAEFLDWNPVDAELLDIQTKNHFHPLRRRIAIERVRRWAELHSIGATLERGLNPEAAK